MNVDLDRLVSSVAFRAASTPGNLIPILKAELPQAEYLEFSRAIARCLDQISQTMIEQACAHAPQVKKDHKVRVARFGPVFLTRSVALQ